MLRRSIKLKTVLYFVIGLTVVLLLFSSWDLVSKHKNISHHKALDLEVTDVVYFDISMNGVVLGRIEIGLFGNLVPKTVKNFVALAQGFKTRIDGKEGRLGYKGTIFHRVVRDFMIQGGNVSNDNSTDNISLFGGVFPDENFLLKHQAEGWVSMANRGPNSNACQFFITLAAAPWLDGHHVVFGKLLEGMNIVRTIGAVETVQDQPRTPVKIVDAGSKVPSPFQRKAFSGLAIN